MSEENHEHHHHSHHNIKHGNAFLIGIVLNIAFVAIEIVYGMIANSSALLADGGHNASDVLSLMFAYAAAYVATKNPTKKYTYGFKRTTILVSILNALLLFVAVAFIAYDAFSKLINPEPVVGDIIIIVAAIGVVINTATALLFMKGQKEDLNIKGAFLHMAADAAVSLAVVIAGISIKFTGAYWIDPAMSFVVIIVIVWGTWKLLVESINLALDAVPKNTDIDKIRDYLLSLQGVVDVHDLHIWAMSTTQNALTAHIVVPEGHTDEFIFSIQRELKENYNIHHTTLQIEKTLIEGNYDKNCLDCN